MKQGRWAIAAVSVVLGVMIVVQFRMTQETAGNNIRLQRTEDLASKLADTEKQNDQLKKELETFRSSSDEAQATVATAATTLSSYESLMMVSEQFNSSEYTQF